MNWIDKIYIISLKKHEIRRQTIFSDLDSAGFDTSKIEWIDAIDGNELDINQCIQNKTINTTFKDPVGILTKSIYGCAMSHNMVYENFLETKDEEIALILEDDASVTHTLLRLLLTKGFGYEKFSEELKTTDWDILLMGGQEKRIEYSQSNSFILKPVKRYPVNYAGHSYLITKNGAKKLLESNKTVQFAADTNIYCCDAKLYCTPISYFTQKVGTLEKYTHTRLKKEFEMFLMIYEGLGEEIVSSTTFGDYGFAESEFESLYKTSQVSNKIQLDGINWNSFIAPNGDEIKNWANINLKYE